MNAPIALLTDFGPSDAYVGVMKGVMLARNPNAVLVDLCHEVPPQDVRRAAFLLATSVTYFPPGTVILAVVDPGVGTERRGLALQAADWRLVGPDNGLFAWALRFLARDRPLELKVEHGELRIGGAVQAVELTEPRFWRPRVSSTFHGRDVFGPVAAELSLGRPLAELGRPVDRIVDLPWPEPAAASDGSRLGEVVSVDQYGNLITNLEPGHLPASPIFELASRRIRGLAAHFSSTQPLVALIGSSGLIEIASPNGSAAGLLGIGEGAEVWVRSERRDSHSQEWARPG